MAHLSKEVYLKALLIWCRAEQGLVSFVG